MSTEPAKTESANACPAGSKPENKSRWQRIWDFLLWIWHILFRKGGIGLVLLLVTMFIFGREVKNLSELFYFPPKDKPFAIFLIWTVAITCWTATRSIVGLLPSLAAPHNKAGGEGQKSPAEPPLKTGGEGQKRELLNSESKIRSLCIVLLVFFAIVAILVGVFGVALYNGFSSIYVSTPTSEKKVSNETASEVFFHPLFPSKEFSEGIRSRERFQDAVDNDAQWVRDRLAEEPTVILTKILILGSALVAVGGIIVGTTVLSSLPVPPVSGEETFMEALKKLFSP